MVDVVPPAGDGADPAGPGLTVAMHMSDGLVNAPTAAAFGLVAVLGLAIAASRARADLDERTAPMAGLVTAFVFAVQMINFPILPGASGHLLGGALVAILVGPWVGSLCIAIVLVVQALLFADGGLTALGHQHHEHGARGRVHRLRRGVRAAPGRARAPAAACVATAFVAALVNTVVAVAGLRGRVRDRRRGRRRAGHRVRADGRAARARRHRRGDHHRGHGRRGRGHPPRPRVPAA